VQSGFGAPADVLALAEVARPTIGPSEVLVRVRAVGIAKGTWLTTLGLPYIARPSYGIRRPKHPVAGHQFAGTVVDPGAGVGGLSVGDAVLGAGHGALAELVAAPVDTIVRMPANLTYAQASAAPVSGLAALQAVRDGAKVESGHRVLVVGASGGVGSFVVQIAKAFGAEVTGVASTRNLALVRDLGASQVLDYTRDDPTAGRPGYDAIIDMAGNRPVARLRKALAPDGALVLVGGSGGRWTMGFQRTIGAMLLAPFVRHRLVGLISTPNQPDLAALADLMASGKVTPLLDASYPLVRAGKAVEAAGKGGARGTPVVLL